MLQSKMSIKSRDVIQHDVVGMRNVALVKMVLTSAVVSQDIGVLFLLVVFNVRLNSIVTRTKLAMKQNVLIHALAFVARMRIAMCLITKQTAVQKDLNRNVLLILIVLSTKLVMGINALIHAQIFAARIALIVKLKITEHIALANQDSMGHRTDSVFEMVLLNSQLCIRRFRKKHSLIEKNQLVCWLMFYIYLH